MCFALMHDDDDAHNLLYAILGCYATWLDRGTCFERHLAFCYITESIGLILKCWWWCVWGVIIKCYAWLSGVWERCTAFTQRLLWYSPLGFHLCTAWARGWVPVTALTLLLHLLPGGRLNVVELLICLDTDYCLRLLWDKHWKRLQTTGIKKVLNCA